MILVSDNMQEYLDYLEIIETLPKPKVTYISDKIPDNYPMLPWETILDNRKEEDYKTVYAYRIILQLIEQYMPGWKGSEVLRRNIHMHVLTIKNNDDEWKMIWSGPIQENVNYVYNEELVIRFKESGLDSYESDGVCLTTFYASVF